MNDQILKSIVERLQRLEADVSSLKDRGASSAKSLHTEDEAAFSGVTGGLRFLVSQGFFKSAKSLGDIKEGLEKHDYHSSLQAVQMGLNRLAKPAGLLIAFKENGKKYYAKRK